jgi:hypothetical protein
VLAGWRRQLNDDHVFRFSSDVPETVHESARILLYGLLEAASPTVLLETLVVLGGGRGRAAGTAFMAAFVLGTSTAFTAGLFVGDSITHTDKGGLDFATLLELAAGVLLLFVRRRGGEGDREREEAERAAEAKSDPSLAAQQPYKAIIEKDEGFFAM